MAQALVRRVASLATIPIFMSQRWPTLVPGKFSLGYEGLENANDTDRIPWAYGSLGTPSENAIQSPSANSGDVDLGTKIDSANLNKHLREGKQFLRHGDGSQTYLIIMMILRPTEALFDTMKNMPHVGMMTILPLCYDVM